MPVYSVYTMMPVYSIYTMMPVYSVYFIQSIQYTKHNLVASIPQKSAVNLVYGSDINGIHDIEDIHGNGIWYT